MKALSVTSCIYFHHFLPYNSVLLVFFAKPCERGIALPCIRTFNFFWNVQRILYTCRDRLSNKYINPGVVSFESVEHKNQNKQLMH